MGGTSKTKTSRAPRQARRPSLPLPQEESAPSVKVSMELNLVREVKERERDALFAQQTPASGKAEKCKQNQHK